VVSFPEIPLFVLHTMPKEMAHLCPVRAYTDWLAVSEINEGYIFCKMTSDDRISQANEPMVHILSTALPTFICHLQTSEYFLEMFCNNLLDIGLDPIPYGTHSFRQGGVQWMSVQLQ
jgi:hypothetical protein